MRRKIVFVKLFNRTDTYSDEILFELFRWMIVTGWNYREGGRGVFEQIYGLSGINCQSYWYDYGFSQWDRATKMQLSFLRAVISQDCSEVVKNWRDDNLIEIFGVRHLNLQISDRPIYKELTTLFKARERKLITQLNECWPQAINIDHVLLTVHQTGWQAHLRYGFDDSLWTHVLAEQGKNTFADFLTEACNELTRIAVCPTT